MCGFWSSGGKAVVGRWSLVNCLQVECTVTLVELENTLPNGFHDSALRSFEVDYARRTLRVRLSLKVGVPDDPPVTRNDSRDAMFEVVGLAFFVVDPPDTGCDFSAGGEVWIGDGYETTSIRQFTRHLIELLKALPEGTFAHSFFVSDWNSYIHVAGTDCSLEWIGEKYSVLGRRKAYLPGETID